MKKLLSIFCVLILILSASSFVFGISYSDVPSSHAHFTEIMFCTERGIFEGANGKFDGDVSLTRAMMITMLCRDALGSEENYTPAKDFKYSGYSDVKKGDWYYSAVEWGTEKGYVEGIGNGLFAPKKGLKIVEFAQMLYNIEKEKGLTGNAAGETEGFVDSKDIPAWGIPAMEWAVSAGILRADGANKLNSNKIMTREEAAIALYRYFNL